MAEDQIERMAELSSGIATKTRVEVGDVVVTMMVDDSALEAFAAKLERIAAFIRKEFAPAQPTVKESRVDG